MPRISFKSEDSEGGWEPLPDGTYNLIIDAVEEKMSTKGNRQLMVTAHVSEGPHDGKKCTIWYAMTLKSGWKMEMLLEAAGVEWEKTETAETNPDTGKPLNELNFDTDDLPGCEIVVDATVQNYQGKDQQRFSDERAPEGAAASSGANGSGQQQPDDATPAPTSGDQTPPAEGQQSTGRRRRRV